MSHYTVVYDANLLYPAALRSILVYLTTTGLFRAKWTALIHEEWIRNLLEKRPDLSRPQLEKQRDLLIRAVPDSMVTGHECLIEHLQLPDPNDRHVLAAAKWVKAEVIVTMNLKDFPIETLAEHECQAVHPDDFILSLFELEPGSVMEIFKKDRTHYLKPPYTVDEYFDLLRRQGLTKTVASLALYRELL